MSAAETGQMSSVETRQMSQDYFHFYFSREVRGVRGKGGVGGGGLTKVIAFGIKNAHYVLYWLGSCRTIHSFNTVMTHDKLSLGVFPWVKSTVQTQARSPTAGSHNWRADD